MNPLYVRDQEKMEEIKNWSVQEGHKKKYELFYQSFQKRIKEKSH